MFPAAGEEKIDAVIFSNGFSLISVTEVHQSIGLEKDNESYTRDNIDV